MEVRSQYYPEQSNPLKDQYIFVYKVKITNQSPQTVQLVSRTWEIKAIEATEVRAVFVPYRFVRVRTLTAWLEKGKKSKKIK